MKALSYRYTLLVRAGVWGRKVWVTEEDPLVSNSLDEGSVKEHFKDKYSN